MNYGLFIFAFVGVLALIGGVAWLVRRFAGNRLGASANRGRMPRLAVIDAAAVDGRRRLVLVRRDNIEHLLMIGGPTDIVVESNIVRANAARDQMPQRPAVGGGAEPPQPRLVPLPDSGGRGDSDGSRSDGFDHVEPQLPEPPSRPARPSFADEVRRPAAAERRGDPLTGFTPEPLAGRAEPHSEPMPLRLPSRNEPMMPRLPRVNVSDAPKPPPLRAPERAPAPAPPPRNASVRRRWRPNRRRSVSTRRRALSNRWRRRSPRQRRRAVLKISKTRWRHCWAVRRTLREAGESPA